MLSLSPPPSSVPIPVPIRPRVTSPPPQDASPVKLECTALAGHRRLCSVGYPVFRSLAKVGDGDPPRDTPWDPPSDPMHPSRPARPQISFTLELEFSCSVLLDRAEVALEARR